jgi:acyl carrier protein
VRHAPESAASVASVERVEVLRRVQEVAALVLELAPEQLPESAAFLDLGIDSLALVEVALRLEDDVDVELPEEVVTALETVGDLVDAVLQQLSPHLPRERYPLTVVTETWNGGPARSYAGRPATVVDVLDQAVRDDPYRVLFVLRDGTSLQRRDFADLVEGAARRLRAQGLRPGDVVAVAARNGLELAVAQFACARAHLVLCGLNVHQAPSLWQWLVQSSGARLVLAQPEFADALPGARDAEELLLASGEPWSYDPGVDRPDEAATYCLVHTSGTTGRPKASRVVHRASVHSAMSYAHLLDLQPEDVSAVLFPLYYISAMHAHVLPALLTGGSCLLLPEASPSGYVEALARHGVTWAYAVPSFWQLVVRRGGISAERLPHLRRIGMGGSPWPPGMEAELRERLPQARLYDVYGLSETHSPATMLLDEEFPAHGGTIGRVLPCMEARTDGPDGQPGELLLRGSLVTTGYEGDPAATAAAISPDGWFRTGDVARIDADGFVTVLDRVKDMVNRGGHKVFSAELERVLRELDGVLDAAVVGVPDAVGEELVAAFLVCEPDAAPAPAAVRRHVAGALADYAVPRFVHVVEELPRGATGKTDKTRLRQEAIQRSSSGR